MIRYPGSIPPKSGCGEPRPVARWEWRAANIVVPTNKDAPANDGIFGGMTSVLGNNNGATLH
jgi:hypothetical protein